MNDLKQQLAAAFPWLTTDEEDQQSGADVIDQLQQFYDGLDDSAEAEVAAAERSTRIAAGSDDGQEAERLLEVVVAAQHAYWDAESELERRLDIEIDDVDDYEQWTVDSLVEKFGDSDNG